MGVKVTTTLRKISALMKEHPEAHVYALPGGQASGKTSAVLLLLINHALRTPKWDCYVAGRELSKMKVTVMKTFKNLMEELGIYDDERFKAGVDYVFENKAHIRFLSLDRPGAYKGNRSDCCMIDEANECGWEAYRELAARSKKVILTWNPNKKTFCEDIIMNMPTTVSVRTTFLDNEFCPENEVEELLAYKKAAYDSEGNVVNQEMARLWKVYGEGLPCKAVGQIFSNYFEGEYVETDSHCYGLDFGYSNDPDALVEVSVDRQNKTLYIREVIYNKGLSTDDLTYTIKSKVTPRHLIVCDSAASRTIADLQLKGVKATGAKKNKVVDDIKELQSWKIVIDPSSNNVLTEFQSYAWKEDGLIPIDAYNHAIDAMRYAFRYLQTPPKRDEIIIL